MSLSSLHQTYRVLRKPCIRSLGRGTIVECNVNIACRIDLQTLTCLLTSTNCSLTTELPLHQVTFSTKANIIPPKEHSHSFFSFHPLISLSTWNSMQGVKHLKRIMRFLECWCPWESDRNVRDWKERKNKCDWIKQLNAFKPIFQFIINYSSLIL